MNEIEEYLLMIFLEDFRYLDEYTYELAKTHGTLANFEWENFKTEELGRTLPEEFELFISKEALGWLREGKSIGISITNRRYDNTPIKIKITVVGNEVR